MKRKSIMKKLVPIRSRSLIASLVVGLVSTLSSAATDLAVPTQYATIQAAVDAASSGDIIRIAAGVYLEQVVIVSKNLTLDAARGAVLKAKPGFILSFEEPVPVLPVSNAPFGTEFPQPAREKDSLSA